MMEIEYILAMLIINNENDKMMFAMLTFFANIVHLEIIKTTIKTRINEFVNKLFSIFKHSDDSSIIHRILYILDEIRDYIDINLQDKDLILKKLS
jgi:uncharacterized protein YpuA (DUF1002 family)